MKTLYQSIVDAGIPYDHHESDLYVPATEAVKAILVKYPTELANVTHFRHQTTGELWLDVPFAFDPFWQEKLNRPA